MSNVHTLAVVKKLTPKEAQQQLRALIAPVRKEICGDCKKRFAEFFKINFPEKVNPLEQNQRQEIEFWLRANMPNHSLPYFFPSTV